MQNKGLINFFAIMLTAVSLYYISFTFIGNSIKKDAKTFAKGNFQKEQKYLDSIAKEKVFLGLFTYDDVRDKEIKKGLDLEGGINIILEISVKDILKGLANQSTHPVFNKALENAKVNQEGNETYIDAFFRNFKSLSNGQTKLASPEIFANRSFEEVKFDMTDGQVETILKKKVNETVISAFEVLRKRIDQFGVTQPNIQQLGESGRILIELPGAKDVDRVKKLVGGTAQLEFWETYKFDEVSNYLQQIDQLSTTLGKSAVASAVVDTTKKDTLNQLIADKKDETLKSSPFQKVFTFLGGTVLGTSKDTAAVNKLIKSPQALALRPANLKFMKLAWGKPAVNEETGDVTYDLYALKGNKENKAPISGGVIVDATSAFDQLGKPAVSMQMNGEGAKQWEKLTGAVHKGQNAIAIVLDDIVYSAPGVSNGAISGGRSEISGQFVVSETEDLANVLKAGKLPAKADIVQSDVVGPSLGQEAINSGFLSFLLGLLLVVAWMILYYGKAGVYANISLLVNIILLIGGGIASFGFVLTLPGIAGIVLTLGMAVDANVILFERAKEGLRAGKTLDVAVDEAYTFKGGLSSIFDANITTMLTAIILFIFGTGPIKGFAITLMIGIITSVFTAIFVSKFLIDWAVARKSKLTFDTSISKNWFKNIHFDFMSKKKLAYMISGVLVIASLIGLFTIGLNKGIDFEGGRTFLVKFPKDVVASEVSKAMSAKFGVNVEAKTFGSDDQLKLSTKFKVSEEGVEVDEQVNQKLYEGLKPYFDANFSYEKFITNDEDKTIGLLQSTKVGPTIAEDIKRDSFYAIFGSLVAIFLYILFRFRKYQYSLGAVTALFHDVIIVLGLFALGWKFLPINMEIDQAFIAAILTVVGYSINDTVIIFDRIRENLGLHHHRMTEKLLNESLSETLSRTINTSFTTLIVLLSIFIFGGETIRGFVFAILVGIFVGTYSSLFVAAPITYDTLKKSQGADVPTA
jgi:SecD/SecF fusion protein